MDYIITIDAGTTNTRTVLFDRDRMVFLGNSAHTNGSKLSDVYVEIPSMAANDARSDLYIHGSAAGSAQQMLDYTVKSPISGWLDGFFDPAVASGAAALKLALQIPLDAPEKTLVSGKVHRKRCIKPCDY